LQRDVGVCRGLIQVAVASEDVKLKLTSRQRRNQIGDRTHGSACFVSGQVPICNAQNTGHSLDDSQLRTVGLASWATVRTGTETGEANSAEDNCASRSSWE